MKDKNIMKKNLPILKPSVDHIHQVTKRPPKDTQLQLRIDRFTKNKWSVAAKLRGAPSLTKYVVDAVNEKVDAVK